MPSATDSWPTPSFILFTQIVQLMKLSHHSNTPLSDTFLPSNFVIKPIHWPHEFLQHHTITKNLQSWIMNKLGEVSLDHGLIIIVFSF